MLRNFGFIILQTLTIIFLSISIAAQISTLPIAWIGMTFLNIISIIMLYKILEKSPYLEKNLIIFLIIFYTAAVIGWCLYYQSQQISDFGVYYRCGTSFSASSSLIDWINNCQSNYTFENSFYWTRSLLYTVPFGIIFGDNYLALKLLNGAAHILSIIVFYKLIKQLYGRRLGTLATLILMVNPEWWFTLTLATSDNLTILFITLFLFCIQNELTTKNSRWLLMIPVYSVALLVLDLLRSTGIILIIAMCISFFFGGITPKHDPYRRLWIAFSVIFFYYVAWHLIYLYAAPPTIYDQHIFEYLSAIDFSTTQSFSDNFPWNQYFWESIPNNLHTTIAFKKMLLQIINQIGLYPSYLFEKAKTLFSGIGYYYLSSVDVGYNADTVKTALQSNIPVKHGIYYFFQALTTAMLILCWVRLIFKDIKESNSLAFTSYLAAFIFIVLGFAEPQSRYSVLIAPALVVLSSLGAKKLSTKGFFCQKTKKRVLLIFSTATIVSFIFYIAVLLSHLIKEKMSYHLNQFQQESRMLVDHQECNNTKIKFTSSFEKFELNFPENFQGCASFSYHFSNNQQYLAFFVSSQEFPFKYQPKTISHFKYRILINGKDVLSDELNYNSVKFYKIPFPEIKQKTITWIVTTTEKTSHNEKLALLYFM